MLYDYNKASLLKNKCQIFTVFAHCYNRLYYDIVLLIIKASITLAVFRGDNNSQG